jgi:threonine/homoserine/homoserine lactone efflux protein
MGTHHRSLIQLAGQPAGNLFLIFVLVAGLLSVLTLLRHYYSFLSWLCCSVLTRLSKYPLLPGNGFSVDGH